MQSIASPTPAISESTAKPSRSSEKIVSLHQPRKVAPNPHLPVLRKLEAEKTVLEQVLQFEAKMRAMDTLQSLKYFAVNELKKLVSCRQVLLFTSKGRSHVLITDTVSGLAVPDIRSPLLVWLAKEIARQVFLPKPDVNIPPENGLAEKGVLLRLNNSDSPQNSLASTYAMASKLTNRNGRAYGVLVFLFDAPVQAHQQKLADRFCQALSHNWLALGGKNPFGAFEIPRAVRWSVALVSLLVLYIPVPLTVLAPVIIDARNPGLITAPLTGVIEKIHVEPNRLVQAGDILFSYEKTESRNQLEQARRDVAIAEAKYRRSNQDAFGAGNGRRDLAVAKAELDLAITELASIQRRSSLLDVVATRSGIVLFESVEKWTGSPVSTGERVFRIADPGAVEFRIDLPAPEAIILSQIKTARAFLDSDPLNPVAVTIARTTYEAEMSDAGVLGFPLYGLTDIEGNPDDGSPPLRIGLRGTAQLVGEKVPLWFFLFRKPLSFLRQFTGI